MVAKVIYSHKVISFIDLSNGLSSEAFNYDGRETKWIIVKNGYYPFHPHHLLYRANRVV